MEAKSKIYVAGHKGLVGSALVRKLRAQGFHNLVLRTRQELDLTRGYDVDEFFRVERPEYVFLAAAKVGGIHANSTYPVVFLLENLKIQSNVIEASWRHGVKGLLFLGSSCIYPKLAPQPLKEEYLLTGPLECTNEPYAVAKIAGIELCEAYNRQFGTRFLSVMPTNLYGPNDRYDLETSHVLPAMIRKLHLAMLASQGEWDAVARDVSCHGPIPSEFATNLASIARHHGRQPPMELLSHGQSVIDPDPAVKLWGTGSARRELLYSDDAASACIFLMRRLEGVFTGSNVPAANGETSLAARNLFNIGCGQDLTIRELAESIAAVIGFTGPILWDNSKPDGTPQKLLDVSRIQALGWKPEVSLRDGVECAYMDYFTKE